MRTSGIILGVSLVCVTLLSQSCDSVIFEPEGDCDPIHRIYFRYEMNMKFADAFHAEVPSVNLLLFDREGNKVLSRSEKVPADEDQAKNFYIELKDLPKGHYDILAWCGTDDNEHFTVNHTGEPQPLLHHHTCRIERQDDPAAGMSHVRGDIGCLFHGRLADVDMTQDEGISNHVVSLTKDTNVIRVVLQHLSGEPISKDDFVFTITESNGLMSAANDLMEDDMLTYHPWSQEEGTAEFTGDAEENPVGGTKAQTSVSAVVTEFTVGRLMAGRNATLTVSRSDNGKKILSIPVNDYALLVKGNYYRPGGTRPLSDQEYLDRQDEYPMTFFLDDNNRWINSVIYINKWRVVLNNSGVH